MWKIVLFKEVFVIKFFLSIFKVKYNIFNVENEMNK